MNTFNRNNQSRFPLAVWMVVICIALISLASYTQRAHARQSTLNAIRPESAANQARIRQSKQMAARLAELQAKSSDGRYLLTRAKLFDPLTEAPSDVSLLSPKAKAANEAGYFIVQFNGVIRSEWASQLRAQGAEIAGYLPNNAYLIRATAARLARVQKISGVRWIGAYGASLKLAPELNEISESVPAVHLSLLSFAGESLKSLRNELTDLPLLSEPILEERDDQRIWGMVSLQREAVPAVTNALAQIEGIEWIEERRANRLHNDQLVRLVQSGYLNADTPLYRQGLTGAGQIYGTADSGLDADHAQFRLSSDASAQTYSLATTTASLTNGLLPFRITNANNKVLSYFLLGSSSFSELKDNPNGGQTLDPTKQSGTRFLNAVAYDDNGAGYFHGTLTTSIAVGRNYAANATGALPGIATRSMGDGIAPDARLVFQDVGHTNGQLPGVDSVSQAQVHQQAYNAGVRVHNNSYGPEPPAVYDQGAADIDDAMWRLRDYTVFFSAGNDSAGDFQITNAAKNNLVIGATESSRNNGQLANLASYSNHGPTFDGRIKPDLVVAGTVIGATENSSDQNSSSYTNATSATAKDASVNPDDPNNNSSLLEDALSGTSFASAAAAGSALLVRQYFTDGFYPSGAKISANGFIPSNALVKAAMLNSGQNLTGRFTASNYPISTSGALPNAGQGWGRIALDDTLYFTGDRRELKVLADIHNGATASDGTRPAANAAITTGQTHTYQLANVSNIEPLRITLTWSDPRAAVGATVALVNNLNLEVIAPDGTLYRGNVNFANAFSQAAGAASADDRNPVEAVYIQNPHAGNYTVRVIGANVPGNGQTQILAQPGDQRIDSNRQGYALIASGNFSAGAVAAVQVTESNISGGVNNDPFISRNETVTAKVTLQNTSPLVARTVTTKIEVDVSSDVPASAIRFNNLATGAALSFNIGDVAGNGTREASFQITLVDDGIDRSGQTILFRVTLIPTNGSQSVSQFSTLAQMKLVTYRTRFESTADTTGSGIIAIPEASWKKRTDDTNRAKEKTVFDSDWKLVSLNSSLNSSTMSLSDPSGTGSSYGVAETSRSDGQVFDDTRWWSPKLPLPGLFVNAATGLVTNPEKAALLKAEIDSFEVDVKADFTGDRAPSASSGDFFILRARAYDNSTSIRATNDAGGNDETLTNLLYLNADTVSGTGFIHYSGSNFASGNGRFFYDEDEAEADTSDVFFRIELQMRRNSLTQSGEGVFVDNLVLRLRVADTAVYASPTAGALATVNAASYDRTVSPGQIVAAFGSGSAATTNITVTAATLPLPTDLNGFVVQVNGVSAPLFFVAAQAGAFQINYQLPFETATGVAQVDVIQDGKLVATEYLVVSDGAPGVFTANASGNGQAIALNQDYSINSPTQAITRGQFLILYATGQGSTLINPVSREILRLPTGYPAPAGTTLYTTPDLPVVTIGGIAAPVAYSGMAQGFVGLWQLNVQVPANAPTGASVPIVVTHYGQTSRVTTIAIK